MSTTTSTQPLSIELSDRDMSRYGSIHKTGCRDLKDPERLGDVSSKSEAFDKAEDLTGWGYEEGEYKFAPCVHLH
jgi:hypothetical protein